MEDLNYGLKVEIIWFDQDVVECQFSCSNGRFSGVAEIYTSHEGFSKMAEAIKGFPCGASDVRDLEFGTFDPSHAGGGVRLHLYCTDSVGHSAIDVKLRRDACKGLGMPESVALKLPVEAAAVDLFVTQLGSIDTEQIGATALLPMAS